MSTPTTRGGELYIGQPHPESWERSRYHPTVVFIKSYDIPGGMGCTQCIFAHNPGCSNHPCNGGAWVDELQAAILRMES